MHLIMAFVLGKELLLPFTEKRNKVLQTQTQGFSCYEGKRYKYCLHAKKLFDKIGTGISTVVQFD